MIKRYLIIKNQKVKNKSRKAEMEQNNERNDY